MALTLEIKNAEGLNVGSVELPSEIFDVQTNIPLIHQVVTAQLAAARQGTQKAKNRGESDGPESPTITTKLIFRSTVTRYLINQAIHTGLSIRLTQLLCRTVLSLKSSPRTLTGSILIFRNFMEGST